MVNTHPCPHGEYETCHYCNPDHDRTGCPYTADHEAEDRMRCPLCGDLPWQHPNGVNCDIPTDLHPDDECPHGNRAGDCMRCWEAQSFAAADRVEVEVNSWAPIDLGPYLRGEIVRPEPTVGLARSDGLRLLYPGKEHAVIGEMESGKSWFSLASVAAELMAGHHVVYLHFEEADPSDTVERLLALQVYGHDIVKLFHFVAPQREVSSEDLARLLDPAPSLVVFDGVNEAMSLHRWGIREEDGAALFRRHLVMPCTRIGAATLSCDHVVKDVERRGRNALGSIHKGNGLSGSLIMLENAESFGRGEKGRSHVFVTKDRPGHLRRNGRPTKATPGKTFMGELVVDDRRLFQPQLELKFFAPAEPEPAVMLGQGDSDEAKVMAAVTAIVAKDALASLRTVRATAGLGKDKVDGALVRLTLSGDLVEEPGARGARIFRLPTAAQESPTVAQDPIPGTVS